jgi:hypothetical protein
MATEATVFLGSTLTVDELPGLPDRLLSECAHVRRAFTDWGWAPDVDRFEWWTALRDGRCELSTRADRWAARKTVTLFGPSGHLSFGPGWIEWSTDVKWRWLFDADPAYREELAAGAAELAKLVGCPDSVGVVANDTGDDGDVEDLLIEDGDIGAVITKLIARGRRPAPLADPESWGRSPSGLFTVSLA